MAMLHSVEAADDPIDDRLNEQLDAHRGKWVAIVPPTRLLGVGETALEAFSAGQAAGEPRPTILRLPEREIDGP